MEVDEDSLGMFTTLDYDHFDFASEVQYGAAVVDNNHVPDAHVRAKPKQGAADGMPADDETPQVTEDGHSDQDDGDMQEKAPLNYELQQGFRILKELMADGNKTVNWPFVDKVDDSYPETIDYFERIKHPMWLNKMEKRFEEREYNTITEVVADFRLMLENCYRFNGPDHHISKKGQRLETMLEQKLALLSRELRAKTTVAATSGRKDDEEFITSGLRRRPKAYLPHDSSTLLNQLRNEEAQREKESRRQQIADRRAANEAAQKEILDWESCSLLAEPIKSHMMHSWELPQIGLFLYLLREPLNMGEIPQFELERCLAMSQQSPTLHLIMTSLLSTPFQRLKIDRKKVMPYSVWTFKLTKKLDVWYKVLSDCGRDKTLAANKLGLDAKSFDIMGARNPLRKRSFHKHSFYRKIWILKSLCDYCLETQESLRKYLEDNQPIEDQRELMLGKDAKGNLYIHFPQFCGMDLRIYRQRKLQFPESSDEEEEEETLPEQLLSTSAKKKLKLGNKNGRSATPTKDSESEGVPSPAPSSTKSRSQSSTSSPMPKDGAGRNRQTNTRNTPLHNHSQDSIFGATSGSRTRKTRNSAEASLLFSLMDIEAIGRRRSRRGKAAESENVDSESCCSNVGEENSQDGMPSVCNSNASLLTSVTSKQSEVGVCEKSEADKTNSNTLVKAECDSIDCKLSPIPAKTECNDAEAPGDNGRLHVKTHPDSSHSKQSQQTLSRIKTEKDSGNENHLIKKEASEAKGIKKESMNCDDGDSSSVQHSSASKDDSSVDSKPVCDRTEKKTIAYSDSECKNQTAITNTKSPDCDTKESKADDSGFMSAGCANGSPKDSDDDTGSDKAADTSDGVMDVQAALFDHAAYSASAVTVKTPKLRVKEEIIMEDSDEEEEEMEPDLEDFELIVDSVKSLQDLVAQFAETPPPPPDTSSSRKGKKQRVWKPPQRKKCEIELHQRLSGMLNELTKWEHKLVQAASRMRIKMRREFDDFAEELQQEEDAEDWDTEPEGESSDEDGNEDSQTGDEGDDSEESQSDILTTVADKKKKGPSSTPSVASESMENDRRDTEDYEMDVSSRGRLRKRRVIPNNIEDQGLKKKKVVKKADAEGTPVTAAHQPNILQKSQAGKQLNFSYTFSPSGLGDSSALLASLSRQGGAGSVLSLSASQLLAMAVSQRPKTASNVTVAGSVKGQQPQEGMVLSSQGLQILKTYQTPTAATMTPASSKLNSHPEIQKLLSARRPLVVDSRHAPYKTVQLSTMNTASTGKGPAVHSTSSSATTTLTSAVLGSGTGPAQQAAASGVAVATVNAAQREGTMMLAMVGGKPQLVSTSLIQQLMRASNVRIQATTAVTATLATTSTALPSQANTVHPTTTSIMGVSAKPLIPRVRPAAPIQVVRPGVAVQGSNPLQLNSLVLKATTQGPAATLGQLVPQARLQGEAGVVGGSVVSGSAVGSQIVVTPTSMTQVALLGSPGKQLQRYAGNVTVKTLLENRAARKSSEDGEASQSSDSSGQSSAPNTPPKQSVIANSVSVPSVSNSALSVGAPRGMVGGAMIGVVPSVAAVPKSVGVPGVVKLTTQSMLDLAIQTVVTTYHTTLPTADIKVPSPTTLPSLSPKKNVTSVVMSTKAPIPITTHCQSTTTASILNRTAGGSGVNVTSQGAWLNFNSDSRRSAMAQSSDPAKPGMVLTMGGKELEAGSSKILLQVVPQGSTGVSPQTFVQGVMLADGTVIPHGALTQTIQLQTRAAQQIQNSASKAEPSTQLPQAQTVGTVSLASDPGGQTGSSKITTDVLKSMLAAKAYTSIATSQQSVFLSTAGTSTNPSLSAVLEQNAAVVGGRVKVGASMPASALVQQMAGLQKTPRIISAHVAQAQTPARSQVAGGQAGRVVVGQLQGVVGSSASQQQGAPSSAAGRIVLAATHQGQVANIGAVGHQLQGTEKVVTMSLPPGFQLATVPGSTTLQLVAPAQLASGSAGGQPIMAALRGAHGVQQVRLLAAPGGMQKVQILTPQQQQALAVKQLAVAALGGQANVAGQVLHGQAAPVPGVNGGAGSQLQAVIQGQQPQVQPQPQQLQLCFKVQPGGQVAAEPTAMSSVTLTQAGVRPVLPRPLVRHTATSLTPSTSLTSPPQQPGILQISPASKPGPSQQHLVVSICPSPSLSVAAQATPLSSPTAASASPPAMLPVSNTPHRVVIQPAGQVAGVGKMASGRMQMTITPDPNTGQLTVSPQAAVLATSTTHSSGRDSSGNPESINPFAQAAGTLNCMGGSLHMGVKGKTAVAAAGQKRAGSDSAVQPIPVKMAHMDTPGSLAGPALANLSQVVGARVDKNSIVGSGVVVSPAKTLPALLSDNVDTVQQRGSSGNQSTVMVKTHGADSIGKASLDSATGTEPLADTVSVMDTASDFSTSQNSQVTQAQINVAQWLQKMQHTSLASAAASSSQRASVPEQSVEPQHLLHQQLQNQQQQQSVVMMRTVGGQLLTPLNIPVTVNNGIVKVLPKANFQVGNQMVTVLSPSNAMIQNLKSPTRVISPNFAAASSSPEPSVSLGDDYPGFAGDSSSDTDSGQEVNLNRTVVVVSSSSSLANSDSTAMVSDGTVVSVSHPTVGTPVLKARLEQPVTSSHVARHSAPSVVNGEQMKIATHSATFTAPTPQKLIFVSERGDACSPNGDAAISVATGGGGGSARGGKPDNFIEKEQAALSLLTFANQVPMD